MIEERVVVSRKTDSQVWVKGLPVASCGNCQQNTACSTPLIEKFLQKREIPVETDLVLESGDQVIVAIHENDLLKGSVVLYLLPIAALLAGAGLGDWVGGYFLGLSPDVLMCISGSISFFLALFLIRSSLQSFFYKSFPKPVVIRKVN